ncbi:MAG: prolipoprotein diacylglyceryl transferase [Anaerolineales bacterium]|nr:prolipoprotein diacylglyceryl transferase [Anaerolineales bacterium]
MYVDPYGIHLGPLYFRFYGLIIMLGALAATYLAGRLLRRRGYDSSLAWDGLIWALIFGIIGARLWHVFTPSQSQIEAGITTAYYLTHPLDLLDTRQGGLGIPGAVIGGIAGLAIFAHRRKLSLAMMLDVASPGLALAQGIGRFGNYVNQELYGPPSDLPWAIPIRPENRLPGYEAFERFHPLFLYEALFNFANAAFLYFLDKKYAGKLLPGDLFLVYLITYPMARFLLEYIRLDISPAFGLNFNQAFMLGVALTSAAALLFRHRRKPVAA